MAGDLPPILVIPLEPTTGSPPRGGLGRSGAAQPVLELHELEPELFAVAWFVAAGDDRLAAHAIGVLRHRWASAAAVVTDPLTQALALLVPHACRLARHAPGVPTGSPTLDLLFTASARARAASALCDGLGLDHALAGRCLGVDRHACESYVRHAHGHARFVGVAEQVRDRFALEVARAREHGVPQRRPLGLHERLLAERRVAVPAVVALLVLAVVAGRSRTDQVSDEGAPYVLLDAPGWQLRSTGLQDPGAVRAVRAYRAVAGANPHASLLVYGPVAAPPPDDGSSSPATSTPETTEVRESGRRAGWQVYTVLSPSCGRTFATAHGLAATDVVDSLRTTRCTATRDVSVAPPPGTAEVVVRSPAAAVATARYERDDAEVTVLAWPSDVGADVPAGPEALVVLRAGRTYVTEPAAPGALLQVRTRVGDLLVVVQGPEAVGRDTLVGLAATTRRVDAEAFRDAAPPTTTVRVTTAPPQRRAAIAPLPSGHRIATATLAGAAQPWWRSLGPPDSSGAAGYIEARVEPAGTAHDVEGPAFDLDVDARRVRVTVIDDRRDPTRPETAADVELHAVWVDGPWQLHLDTAGVRQDELEALLRGAEITADTARWAAFVDAGRGR